MSSVFSDREEPAEQGGPGQGPTWRQCPPGWAPGPPTEPHSCHSSRVPPPQLLGLPLPQRQQGPTNRRQRQRGGGTCPLCPAHPPAGPWQAQPLRPPSHQPSGQHRTEPALSVPALPLGPAWHRQLLPASSPVGQWVTQDAPGGGRLVSVPGGWKGQLCGAPPGRTFLEGARYPARQTGFCAAWPALPPLCLPEAALSTPGALSPGGVLAGVAKQTALGTESRHSCVGPSPSCHHQGSAQDLSDGTDHWPRHRGPWEPGGGPSRWGGAALGPLPIRPG